LGNLIKLESLDMSSNILSGMVPAELTKFELSGSPKSFQSYCWVLKTLIPQRKLTLE